MGVKRGLLLLLSLDGAHRRAQRNANGDPGADIIERRAQGNPQGYPNANILAGEAGLRLGWVCRFSLGCLAFLFCHD